MSKYDDEKTIIYCDIPYKNTTSYKQTFSHDEFYVWLKKQDKTIFISEYLMPNDFQELFSINKIVNFAGANYKTTKEEKLYCNKKITKFYDNFFNKEKINKQLNLF